MQKRTVLVVVLALLVFGTVAMIFASVPTASTSDSTKVATMVAEMEAMSPAGLAALNAIPPKPYTLPEPSVDVMRARLEETYTIAGIGQDTVELRGWIAVTHGKPSTNDWNTAVTATRFVALELHGESKLFGPVNVTFDPEKQVVGEVGRINLPKNALTQLAALQPQAKEKAKAPAAPANGKGKGKGNTGVATKATSADGVDDGTGDPGDGSAAICCRAPVTVAVVMPKLNLKMETREPAVWYSRVTTIPPVGHVASVTVDPVALVTDDARVVGSLDSGRVFFRETVKHVALSGDVDLTTLNSRLASCPVRTGQRVATKKK
jgi:hypothetical protein